MKIHINGFVIETNSVEEAMLIVGKKQKAKEKSITRKRPKLQSHRRWSKKEIEFLLSNLHLMPKQLFKHPELQRHTLAAISGKKHGVKRYLEDNTSTIAGLETINYINEIRENSITFNQ